MLYNNAISNKPVFPYLEKGLVQKSKRLTGPNRY
jgi:hypothetical protein